MGKVHKTYYKNSPFYQGLFDEYGAVLSLSLATVVAAEHHLSLADLGYPADQSLFGTLELVQRLGY